MKTPIVHDRNLISSHNAGLGMAWLTGFAVHALLTDVAGVSSLWAVATATSAASTLLLGQRVRQANRALVSTLVRAPAERATAGGSCVEQRLEHSDEVERELRQRLLQANIDQARTNAQLHESEEQASRLSARLQRVEAEREGLLVAIEQLEHGAHHELLPAPKRQPHKEAAETGVTNTREADLDDDDAAVPAEVPAVRRKTP